MFKLSFVSVAVRTEFGTPAMSLPGSERQLYDIDLFDKATGSSIRVIDTDNSYPDVCTIPKGHCIDSEKEDIAHGMKKHTRVFGITGAGKTRLAQACITQAIHAGHAPICLDPRGDQSMRERISMIDNADRHPSNHHQGENKC